MITIGIFTTKGGAGKTTTVFNMAGILNKDYDKKVLLVDGDPASNLTTCCLASKIIENNGSKDFLNQEHGVEHLFLYPHDINEAIDNMMFSLVQNGKPSKRGIDIIPTKPRDIHPKLRLYNVDKALESGGYEEGLFAKSLTMIKRTIKHRYFYDYCLIDFEGSSDPKHFTEEFLYACDYIFIPSTIDPFSLSQTASVLDYIDDFKKRRNARLKVGGVFNTATNQFGAYDEQTRQVYREELQDKFIEASIRQAVEAKWSVDSGIPLAYNRKSHPLTNDYRALTSEIIKRTEG